ncbi:TonB-dependent receptor plug domain-containing protein [Terriglobus aquaticus]|uniref:TonB-dependent receptor plug domain-containing protein n=1 Tax=Terriglobus aquaticus TaxID=940139 RepID=A0ABW9KRF8_9BACT|nr:TonB-dependent receptor [Terriglobus aquaticus]
MCEAAQQAPTALADRALSELMTIPVYSASRSSQSVSEAPASVSVVTREDIRRGGYRTLGDILRNVRGFYISTDRQYTYAGVRGFSEPGNYNTRILLMVDSHRMNDAVYEQASLGNEFALDVDLIERVEVVLGPSSSLYGTNAVFAVVNVIARTAESYRGFELSTNAGSWNSYRQRISYGGRIAGIDTVLSGTFYNSKGENRLYYPEYDSPLTNNGIASHLDGDTLAQGFLKASGHGLRLEAAYGTRQAADPTGAWGDIFNDPDNWSRDTRDFVELKYDRKLPLGNVMARAYFDAEHASGSYPYADASSTRVLNHDYAQGRSAGMEVEASTKLRDRYALVGGFEYRDDYKQHQSNFDENPFVLALDTNNPAFVAAPYFEAKIPLLRGLTLTPSIREDYNPRVGWTVSPRAALTYHATEQTTARLIYGESFRTPNAYEQYYYPNTAPLRPERDTSWELDLDQTLTSQVSLTAAVYENVLHDFITLTSDQTYDAPYANESREATAGAEIQIDARIRQGSKVTASYSNTFVRRDVEHGWLENSPQNQGKIYATVPLFSRSAFATVDGQYMGRRLTLPKDGEGEGGKHTIHPYALLNATLLVHTPARGLDVSASIYNAFNKVYYDPGAQQHVQEQLQQAGRSFRVKLVWNPGGAR